jgi:hypothetical protein
MYLDPSVGGMLPQVIRGVTDIDDSVQTESTPYNILTITAQDGAPLTDVDVWLDLHKATTGFGAVESTATAQFAVARKVDGTNWRREAYAEAALSGTNAANRCQKLRIGNIAAGESVAIFIAMSADATSDMEIPYEILYKGAQAPTVTPVAAG